MADSTSKTNVAVPPGISGRKLTAIVLIALALLTGTISYVLASYDQIEVARKESDATWVALAEELSTRYKGLETQVAKAVDARILEMEDGERFRLAIDRFRGTATPEKQFEAAKELERLLGNTGLNLEAPAQLDEAASTFNDSISEAIDALNTPGGKVLGVFLKFPELTQFELAS